MRFDLWTDSWGSIKYSIGENGAECDRLVNVNQTDYKPFSRVCSEVLQNSIDVLGGNVPTYIMRLGCYSILLLTVTPDEKIDGYVFYEGFIKKAVRESVFAFIKRHMVEENVFYTCLQQNRLNVPAETFETLDVVPKDVFDEAKEICEELPLGDFRIASAYSKEKSRKFKKVECYDNSKKIEFGNVLKIPGLVGKFLVYVGNTLIEHRHLEIEEAFEGYALQISKKHVKTVITRERRLYDNLLFPLLMKAISSREFGEHVSMQPFRIFINDECYSLSLPKSVEAKAILLANWAFRGSQQEDIEHPDDFWPKDSGGEVTPSRSPFFIGFCEGLLIAISNKFKSLELGNQGVFMVHPYKQKSYQEDHATNPYKKHANIFQQPPLLVPCWTFMMLYLGMQTLQEDSERASVTNILLSGRSPCPPYENKLFDKSIFRPVFVEIQDISALNAGLIKKINGIWEEYPSQLRWLIGLLPKSYEDFLNEITVWGKNPVFLEDVVQIDNAYFDTSDPRCNNFFIQVVGEPNEHDLQKRLRHHYNLDCVKRGLKDMYTSPASEVATCKEEVTSLRKRVRELEEALKGNASEGLRPSTDSKVRLRRGGLKVVGNSKYLKTEIAPCYTEGNVIIDLTNYSESSSQ